MLSENHARLDNSDLNVATSRRRSHPLLPPSLPPVYRGWQFNKRVLAALTWSQEFLRGYFASFPPHFMSDFNSYNFSSSIQETCNFFIFHFLFSFLARVFEYVRKVARRLIRLAALLYSRIHVKKNKIFGKKTFAHTPFSALSDISDKLGTVYIFHNIYTC